MKKLILVLIVLVAVGGATTAYYMKRGAPEPTVTMLQISRGDIVDTVGATGTLQAVETVDVGTQVSGVVQELHADFNHIVRKGQVIARLDPSLIETAIEQREASVTRARADLDRLRVGLTDAKRKHEQAKNLWDKQLIPRDQLETADLNVKTLESQIKSSEAALSQALADLNQQRVNLGHTVIKAPIDGIVISRNVDQGQTVASSMNAPTLYVLAADLTKMQVLANIDESEIGKLRPGQPVTFRVDAYPTETFHGTVSQVRLQPTTVQNVVTYSTVIDVPNPELKLKPGMTATVNVEIARRSNVLRVPNAALRFRPTNDVFAALKQEVPPEMQRGFGRAGPGGPGGPGSAQQPAPAGSASPSPSGAPGATTPSATPRGAAPSTPPAATPQQRSERRVPSAPGGGEAPGSTGSPQAASPRGDRPRAERGEGAGEGRRGEGRGGFGNMTPEEREARRKQFEERLKNMPPEERAQWEQRMRDGRSRDPGAGQATPGGGRDNAAAPQGQRADRGQPNTSTRSAERTPSRSESGSALTRTNATTIDALFAPLPPVEGRGRVWLYINKQLKSVPIRTGISDGTWTEILETPDTAQLEAGTEVVTNVITGLEPANRPGQQGQGSNPLMPQRGMPGQRGGPGGGRGR